MVHSAARLRLTSVSGSSHASTGATSPMTVRLVAAAALRSSLSSDTNTVTYFSTAFMIHFACATRQRRGNGVHGLQTQWAATCAKEPTAAVAAIANDSEYGNRGM